MKKKPDDLMSENQKLSCKTCILELLSQGMPVISDTPLEMRLSLASIMGGVGALANKHNKADDFVEKMAIIMTYLSEASDAEILALIRESKAGAN